MPTPTRVLWNSVLFSSGPSPELDRALVDIAARVSLPEAVQVPIFAALKAIVLNVPPCDDRCAAIVHFQTVLRWLRSAAEQTEGFSHAS